MILSYKMKGDVISDIDTPKVYGDTSIFDGLV